MPVNLIEISATAPLHKLKEILAILLRTMFSIEGTNIPPKKVIPTINAVAITRIIIFFFILNLEYTKLFFASMVVILI